MGIHARPLFDIALPADYGSGDALRAVVRLADRAGFDMFSLTDHPYNPGMYDAYAGLAYLLGATDNIGAYVSVTNSPLRPAPMLARTVATLSDISNDRFVLGIGAGGFWDAIVRMGVPRLTPGEAVESFEKSIQLVRDLTGGGPSVTNDLVQGIQPAPVATPPIWTGSQGPKSLRVTGRLADGWVPPNGADWTTDIVRNGRAIIDAAAVDAGRDPSDVGTIYKLGGALTPFDLAQTRGPNGLFMGGSSRQWVEEITTAVREHGATGFNTSLTDETGAITADVIQRFGDEVIAPARAALG
ncbi:LLM class flavin-dependent oxidoreductase [Microbacterium gorillae]|uniref:LLM class flavin-dependent oxidoreductase n=1 Tax=Microbacterium gorillae TaxID=1231063 RepID=UPI0006939890|nr:LLM class flavin-dependent oxidoreductase [Microbacterium gorillae]